MRPALLFGASRLSRRVALSIGVMALSLAELRAAQAPLFRSTATTVPVYATVVGADGHVLDNLDAQDFQVLDNGRPQPLTQFDCRLQPVNLVVMLDMSGSMSANVGTLRRAAVQMFTRLLPQDRARVGSFGFHIDIGPSDFTSDVDELTRVLWLDLAPGGERPPTPLWNAVDAAVTALHPVTGRRVVLVLSDGKNTGFASRDGVPLGSSLPQLVERAQGEDVMIYAVGMRSAVTPFATAGRSAARGGGTSEPDPGLKTLALQTGGGYVEITEPDRLGAVFAQLADELHHQYLLGFSATESTTRVHRLEVHVSRADVTVRARQAYLTARGTNGPI